MNSHIECLVKLGQKLSHFKTIESLNHLPDEVFFNTGKEIIQMAKHYNHWFLPEQVIYALNSWSKALTIENLDKWTSELQLKIPQHPKKVGLILAGNIPFVGFHDVVSTFILGHVALIKLSSQDKFLIPWLIKFIINENENFKNQFEFVERLENFDAVIATGNNNSAHYFDYYFSKVPHIIRPIATQLLYSQEMNRLMN